MLRRPTHKGTAHEDRSHRRHRPHRGQCPLKVERTRPRRRCSLNLLEAEKQAGVTHHVALSVVGAERLPESGYLGAKQAQEELIKESGVPYSIVHATQFFEFGQSIADCATTGDEVHMPLFWLQPIVEEDVAGIVALTAVGTPRNGTIEIGGPERFRFEELVGHVDVLGHGDPAGSRLAVRGLSASPWMSRKSVGDERRRSHRC